MFSSLRQDSILYLLNKKGTPELSIARVVSISAPAPKYPATFQNPMNGIETTVDITVNIDGNNMELKKIPSSLSIYGDNAVIVSETKEAMNTEIENMRNSSRSIIESIDYHKNVIESCDKMLVMLNPNIAKEKEQENKINALEEKMSSIEAILLDMNNKLNGK